MNTMSKRLAPGITRESDGRLLVIAKVGTERKQCRLPKGTSTPEATRIRLEMTDELKRRADNADTGSLTIRTIEDAMKHLKASPKRRGGERKYLQRESRYDQIIQEIGHVSLHNSYGAVKAFAEKLIKDGLAPATCNRVISLVKAAVRNAYDTREGADYHRAIPENYLSGFPMYPENSICFRNLSTEERDRLWVNLPWAMKPVYYFASCIPVRISELVCITRDRIHLDTRTIDIPMGTTKNGNGRVLVIPEEFMPYVKWMLSTPARYLFNRGEENGYEPIGFGVEPKDTINVRKYSEREQFRSALKKAKIEKYNFHKTRQEAILNMCADGWEQETIRHVGGWESVEAFERYVNKDLCLHIKHGSYKIDQTWKVRYAFELIPANVRKDINLVPFIVSSTTKVYNGADEEKVLIDNMRQVI